MDMHLPQMQSELRWALATNFLDQLRALGGGQTIEQHKKRQGELAAREVGAEGFADALFLPVKIGQIVVNLIGDAEMPAKRGGGLDKTGLISGEARAELTRDAEELGGFQVDDAVVVGASDIGGAAAQGLHRFPRANPPRRCRHGEADLGRGELRGQMQRMGEKRVADEDGGAGTVNAGGGAPAAPHVGIVHDVVVHESGEMHELDDGRGAHEIGGEGVGPPPAAQENQRRPDALARGIDAVIRHRANLRLERGDFGKSIEAIFHLGACSSTTEKNADYLMENNYRYTMRLAAWQEHHLECRMIYASSASTYGDGSRGYSDNEEELHLLRPLNMYGYSKHLFDCYARRKGWLKHIVGLKFFNVFGPNEYHKGDMRSVINKSFPEVRDTGRMRLFKSYRKEYGDG